MQKGSVNYFYQAKQIPMLSQLPMLHRDPFDRMLIAQAMTEPHRFLTSNKILETYYDLVEIV